MNVDVMGFDIVNGARADGAGAKGGGLRPARGEQAGIRYGLEPRWAATSPAAVKERSAAVTRKPYPNYKIIVLNDDVNTFQHVAETLTKYIPSMTPDEAWNLANKIHNEGQAIVWVGPLEQAELYHMQLTRAGLTMAPLEQA